LSGFSVYWTERAKKDLAPLHAAPQVPIIRKVESVKADPLRSFQRLKGETAWGLRVGGYRVIADIVLSERKVTVVAVGHRRSVYR
jgi:mRNA-degrading endonuclease RelE of RelBE toxin-antitoxin system